MCASNKYDGLEIPGKFPDTLTPSLAVVLLCTESERQRRIQWRGNPTEDDLTPNEPGTRAYFFEQYLLQQIDKFSRVTLIMDTTCLQPSEVAEHIIEKLHNDY